MAGYNQVPEGSNAILAGNEETGHRPYGCVCNATFTRLDALERHIRSKTKALAYPCLLCDRYQGPNAFPRADHLAQHMRHKHCNQEPANAEPREQASAPGPAAEPVIARQLLPGLQQLPPFHCTVPGCDRWGSAGFLRQVDFDEHLTVHEWAPWCMPSQLGSAYLAPSPSSYDFAPAQGQEFQQGAHNQPAGGVDQGKSSSMYGVAEQDFQQNMYYPPVGSLFHQDDELEGSRVDEQSGDFQVDHAPGFF